MKNIIFISLLSLFVWACSSPKDIDGSNYSARDIVIDSSEYDVTIMDPDFDRWYLMRYSPGQDRSNEFYRMKNTVAVQNWNDYLIRNRYRRAINSHINYNPSIDYGIDVNRKLYWYFRYIEENYRVPLL